jgi:hypothetical protein
LIFRPASFANPCHPLFGAGGIFFVCAKRNCPSGATLSQRHSGTGIYQPEGNIMSREKMKYKLNVAQDVDTDEPDVYILNLPKGWRFDEASSPDDRVHAKGFDSMKELRAEVKFSVVPCNCSGCK